MHTSFWSHSGLLSDEPNYFGTLTIAELHQAAWKSCHGEAAEVKALRRIWGSARIVHLELSRLFRSGKASPWHQIFCVEIGVVLNCSSYLTRSCYETGCVQSVGLLIGFIQLKKLSCYRNGNSYIFLILLLGSWTGQLRINFSEDKRQWIKVRRHGCDFQTDQRPCVSHLLEA